jgi:hypothetical protein
MVYQPPGDVPGLHVPGTAIPIPWLIDQQFDAYSAGVAERGRRRRRNLLLLQSP